MLIVASSPLLRQQRADANTLTSSSLSSSSSSSSSSSRSATSSEPRVGDTGVTRLPMKIFHDGKVDSKDGAIADGGIFVSIVEVIV